MRRIPWILMGLVCVGIVVGLSGLAGAQQKIVIYAAQDEKTTNEMTRMFTEETKIGTEVIRVAAAGTLATRIRAEKAAPKADIFMGGSVEFHEPLATEGLVLPYREDRPGLREPPELLARVLRQQPGDHPEPPAVPARDRLGRRGQAQDLG